jgi:hypothetical protein
MPDFKMDMNAGVVLPMENMAELMNKNVRLRLKFKVL